MSADPRRVLVTVPFFDEASRGFLEAHNCHVDVIDTPDRHMSATDLVENLRGAKGWIVGHARVTHEVLDASPDLMVIARRGVGYERVDVSAARALGRVVTIATGGNAPSVADQAIGLMLAAGRRFHESRQRMSRGDWTILVGTELHQKTVGLVGFGRVARLVAKRLAGFDAEVLVHAPRLTAVDAAASGVRSVDMQQLLKESDYVSLHLPLNEATGRFIDAASLRLMKDTAILINTSRGGLIDELALLEALREGRLLGAALDVFHVEQDEAHRALAEELLTLPNVVATPHTAGSTTEALTRSNLLAAHAVVKILDGESPPEECVVADGRTREAH